MQRREFMGILAGLGGAWLPALSFAQSLLSAEEAFFVSAQLVEPGVVDVEFRIAPGYRLYRDRFGFRTDDAGVRIKSVSMPPALTRHDPLLDEDVTYYSGRVTARVFIAPAGRACRLIAQAQGCAENGVCYPPLSRAFALPAAGARG